jgi:site-specific recombinase XerD
MTELIITPASVFADRPSVDGRIEARLAAYAQAADGAFSKATEHAIRVDTKVFGDFCAALGRSHLPAEPATIVSFIDHCVGTLGHKLATIERRLTSISHLHKAAGFGGPDNPARSDLVRLRMRKVRREMGCRPRQVAPLGEREAGMIIAAVGAKPKLGLLRDITMLLLARDALLRRGEVVALDHADLEIDGDEALVHIRRSKTDQEGRGGAIQYLGPRATLWLGRWIAAAGIADGPLFRSVNKAARVGGGRLEDREIARAYKRLAELAGLDPAAVSGHSTRVGMAQDFCANGAGLYDLMRAGRWKSLAMVSRYTEHLEAKRGAVAAYYGRRGD